MTGLLNGAQGPPPTFDPEALVEDVAFAMFVASGDPEAPESAATWASLSDGEREAVHDVAREAIRAFTSAVQRMGVRFLPPGAVAPPRTVEEAAVMAELSKRFIGAQGRKSGLVGSVAPKLIVPGRVH